MSVQIEIAAEPDVFNAGHLHRVIEMIENVFDSGATGVAHELPHRGNSEHAARARGGADHFVRLAALYARRQRAAVGMRDEDRFLRCGNYVETGALPAMRNVDRHANRVHTRDHIGCRKR